MAADVVLAVTNHACLRQRVPTASSLLAWDVALEILLGLNLAQEDAHDARAAGIEQHHSDAFVVVQHGLERAKLWRVAPHDILVRSLWQTYCIQVIERT